jgi:hypothetical protein
MDPVLGPVLVEPQQDVGIVDDLGDGFGILGAVVASKALIASWALSMSSAL